MKSITPEVVSREESKCPNLNRRKVEPMTKPSDVPQDVWDVALAIAPLWANGKERMSLEKAIARAVMSEREECASVVASFPENLGTSKGRLVEAIRNRDAK